MIFILLVAFSALFVAGCSAFFSIKGLVVLFSGSPLAIAIMGSSLEIGKLVAASFLHTQWKKTSFLLKMYLCSAVFVLMCITSLGIFGFLTGAYQIHSSKVGNFETQIKALTSEKAIAEQSAVESANRIKILTEIRATQEDNIQKAGNYKAPREQAYKAIAEANEEISKKENSVTQAREKIVALEKEISDIEINLNTNTDIGSFKFIAAALDTSVDNSVRYFIFALIVVFDPLAVALVLAWNKLLEQRAEKKKEEEHVYLRSFIATPDHTHEEIEEPAPILYTKQASPVVQEEAKPTPAQAKETVASIEEVKVPVVEEQQKNITDIDIPVDLVSNMVVGHVEYHPGLENDPDFQALSEEQKAEIRKGRTRRSGGNNSVITI